MAKPDVESDDQRALAVKVDQLTELLSNMNERVQQKVAAISALKSTLQDAVSLRDRFINIEAQFKENVSELLDPLAKLDLKLEDVVKFSITLDPLNEKIADISKKITDLETDNKFDFEEETDLSTLSTLPDLRAAHEHVKEQIVRLKEQLSTPQRRYQNYVERLNSWTEKRSTISGSDVDPKPDTLIWLQQQLKYVDETLASSLQTRVAARREVVKSIFDSKGAILRFYSDLKRSVEGRLESVRAEGFEIEINASFIVDREFSRGFLNHINQRRRGAI